MEHDTTKVVRSKVVVAAKETEKYCVSVRVRKLVAAPAAQLVLVRLDYTRLGRRGKPSVRVNKETARPRLYAYLRIVSLNCLCTGNENRLKTHVLSAVRKQLSVISLLPFFPSFCGYLHYPLRKSVQCGCNDCSTYKLIWKV